MRPFCTHRQDSSIFVNSFVLITPIISRLQSPKVLFNEAWARYASSLVFLVSDTLTPAHDSSPAKPSRRHSFDAGAAWAHLALQATALGYQTHAMAGIFFDQVTRQLSIPERYRVEIAVAIGRQASPTALPPALHEREVPSNRMPLDQIAFAGRFVVDPTNDGTSE
jgi:hypothetical protein